MLNRTNRTLSANLNRLNLGARSLVVLTGVINGKSTLRARLAHAYAHAYASRDGMFRSLDVSPMWSHDPSAITGAIPCVPCSSPSPVDRLSVVDRPDGRWPVVPVVTPGLDVPTVGGTTTLLTNAEPPAQLRNQPEAPGALKASGASKRRPTAARPVRRGWNPGLDRGRDPVRATRTAAARVAAAVG